MKSRSSFLSFLFFPLFVALGFLVMGYHPGIEDDGVYLTAAKADLNPALYPHDADFFRLQMQASLFDNAMAATVKLTGLRLPWVALLLQLLSITLILWACLGIARLLFAERAAQWGAVSMVAAMLTLPVAGTALFIADQHLHPRNLATALILIAVWRILDGRYWLAVPLLLLSCVLHPIMAALGISFCLFTAMVHLQPKPAWQESVRESLAAALPLGWIFESPNSSWRHALDAKSALLLDRWTWYEWLGAIAPLFLFWLLWRLAGRNGKTPLSRLALAVFAYGVFQQIVALGMLGPSALIRLAPLQPMRYLQLVYIFMALVGGGLIGRFFLKEKAWRWALYLILFNGGMFGVQRAMYASSPHIELPGMAASNDWMEAFTWIRQNTPVDAYFALDPNYLAAPGEDFHSFRALAERSQLADANKDCAVVTVVPQLGPEWERQLRAQDGWEHFQIADFQRLKSSFGVDWVLLLRPQAAGLECPWHNRTLAVCRIP